MEAGVSEIPMKRLSGNSCLAQLGMRLKGGGCPTRPFHLCEAALSPDEPSLISLVVDSDSPATMTSPTHHPKYSQVSIQVSARLSCDCG